MLILYVNLLITKIALPQTVIFDGLLLHQLFEPVKCNNEERDEKSRCPRNVPSRLQDINRAEWRSGSVLGP